MAVTVVRCYGRTLDELSLDACFFQWSCCFTHTTKILSLILLARRSPFMTDTVFSTARYVGWKLWACGVWRLG